MKKVILYLNTLSNLTYTQLFFLFYNKLIKKKFLSLFLLSYNSNLSKNKRNKFEEIKGRINKIFGEQHIWNLGIKNEDCHSNYYETLKNHIILFAREKNINPIKKLWIENSDDIELNYNYQRFYLFKEVFDEIKLSDDKQLRIIKKWIKINKKNHLAWTGFNCAIRLINWIKIIQGIDPKKIQPEEWDFIEDSIYKQYRFNRNNIEYHIPSNHIILQYYSVWLITNIFTQWCVPSHKVEKINQNLINEFKVEFSDDGLHFELASHYHLQIVLLGLTVIHQFRNLGVEFPIDVQKLILAGTEIIERFLIDEYFPSISDECYNFFHENRTQDLQNIRFLKNKITSKKKYKEKICLIDNSYLFMEDYSFKVIFDVGEISLKSTPGHGHADILSIILGYNDIPIFIDPGTFQYNNKKESLMLKRTSYHNTVDVDGEDQAKLWGFFRWAYLPKDIASSFKTLDKNTVVLEGEFLGFRHIGGIKHKRRITFNKAMFKINDFLTGNLGKFIHINFILHPDIKIKYDENYILLESKLNIFKISSKQNTTIKIEEINIYNSYNTPSSSKKIVFEYENNHTKEFQTEIIFEVIK